ncbi:hypothetical protein BUALT_Bualt19G0071800 [Buddleja alternifolia]|uniref:Uncharacterized protein n=1 Tax=Buddleja alternifolia TaxID=168488 RepID=A0AAV6W5X2_9LAMI|nr:hypothetical protein BUALT_Bualt19G0071800 [Buddleja alternifolia]
MGSLGVNGVSRKKAMWVHPKVMGANPSERWGHSASYFNALLYIFGGCRGGVHFSDVLVCNLTTMTWNILKTSGQGPGPRDSHSATLVGHRMFVFGGTNGSKKVNDLHILDLVSREWTRPECCGNPPCARESHTANVVGDEKLVIFGGSGEGEANYLNDLHILDLKIMEWSSPEVKGNIPAPRDSHSSVVVGNRLFVFGGDSGDRYQGDVSVLDMNKLSWSRVDTHGPSPGARAGHASMYIIGGVGDKKYYNDIWVLDVITSSWAQLDTCSPNSQGRFSHTATVSNLGIAIFGGCGEDERPLNELLILEIDSLAHSDLLETRTKKKAKCFLKRRRIIRLHQYWQQKITFVGDNEDSTSRDVEELEFIPEQSFRFSSDMLHPKRRRTSNSKVTEKKPDTDEHSLSQSQQSSPSQSDHEQTPVKKSVGSSYPFSRVHPLFRQKISCPSRYHQLNNVLINQTNPPKHAISRTCPDIYSSSEHPNQIKQEHINVICSDGCRAHCKASESLSLEAKKFQNLIGAEVRGQVDGAFDSGYLMTATVNGKAFRGVLFAPGPDFVSRGAVLGQHSLPFAHQIAVNNAIGGKNNSSVGYQRHSQQPPKVLAPGAVHSLEQTQPRRLSPEMRAPISLGKELTVNSELQGVVLTLASPGSDHGRL